MDELDISKSISSLTKLLKNTRAISQSRMNMPMDRPCLQALVNEVNVLTVQANRFLSQLENELTDYDCELS